MTSIFPVIKSNAFILKWMEVNQNKWRGGSENCGTYLWGEGMINSENNNDNDPSPEISGTFF